MIKSFTFISAIILIVMIIASNSIGASSEIPLPDANDINKYFMENRHRFYQRDPDEKNFSADLILPVPFYSLFGSYRIFFVRSLSSRYLENFVIGKIASFGYFASNGKDVLYLSQSNVDNVETLFRDEKIQIDSLDAKAFCDFLSLTLLTNGINFYKVISSVSDIINQVRTDHFSPPRKEDLSVLTFMCEISAGYEINEAEINKIKNVIHPPKISGDKESGWEIEFYSWGGSTHRVTDVARHLFKISGHYKIQHAEETLTTQIFSKIPVIIH